MAIQTQITDDKRVWFERDHEGRSAPVCLVVKTPISDSEIDFWRSLPLTNLEMTIMCAHLQRFVIERVGYFPLAESAPVVAAFEKRLVDAEGRMREWRQKSGLEDERKKARADLLDAAENYVLAKQLGFVDGALAAKLIAAVDAAKKMGV